MTTMVEHGGLLVPADAVPTTDLVETVPAADVAEVEPAGEVVEAELVDGVDDQAVKAAGVARRREPVTATVLAGRLAAKRDVIGARRADVLARREHDVDHEIALADVVERGAEAKRARRDRVQERRESADLGRYYRKAVRSGTRARIRADIDRSAEMRALRVALVRRYAMLVGLPIVIGFAGFSTPGVQAGMVKLLSLDHGSAYWWMAWFVEPLLIAVAVGVIVVKALLKMSGGETDRRADAAKWGALAFSIALNLVGGWTGQHGPVAAFGEALGHSVGAIGAAVVAWLIGVVVDYTSKAKPWDGADRLADMGLDLDPTGVDSDATRTTDDGAFGVGATRTHDAATRTHDSATRTNETERPSSEPVRTGEVVRVAPEVVPVASEGVRDGGESDGTESQKIAARMAWIASYRSGVTLSGAQLGRAAGLGERWGQKRAAEAREELKRLGEIVEVATVGRANGRRLNGTAVAR